MKEALTPEVMANAARMLRSGNPGAAICIVEGADDKKFFKKIFDTSRCQFVVANGWEMAEALLDVLEQAGELGVLAIIDADFRRLDNIQPESPNLFLTDYHDLEISLVDSDAFEKLVAETCDMDSHPHPPPNELRAKLLKAAAPLGYLRWHSLRAGLNLTFAGISYSDFVDKDTLEIDEMAMARVVKNKSQRHDLRELDLVAASTTLMVPSHDLRLVCRGHDVTQIFSIGLRKLFSRRTPSDVTADRLEMVLRAAYSIVHFAASALCDALRRWEMLHKPFRVLNHHDMASNMSNVAT